MIELVGDVDGERRAGAGQGLLRGRHERPARDARLLHGVEYINCTGIALIVGLLARAREQPTLSVRGLTPTTATSSTSPGSPTS